MNNIFNIEEKRNLLWQQYLVNNASHIDAIRKQVAEIHAKVNQHYDEMEYSFHTNMVMNVFMQFGSVCFGVDSLHNDEGLAAIFGAAFHDTIEDARLSYNDVFNLAKRMLPGDKNAHIAAEIVFALTNEKGKTRADRENDKYFEGIRNTPYAPCIKLCDRYANAIYANARMSSLAPKYSNEMDSFLSRLVIISPNKTDIERPFYIPVELANLCKAYPLCRKPENTTTLRDLAVLAELKDSMNNENGASGNKNDENQ